MTPTNIDWADYTSNPVVGCLHNCYYCYARELHQRRHIAYLNGKKLSECYAKPFDQPQFFENRLSKLPKAKLFNTRNNLAGLISPLKPIVFMVSMGDLFGRWVPDQWINKTLSVTTQCHDTQFMFLTKNTDRYEQFQLDFTPNSWIGTSVTEKGSAEKISRLQNIKTRAKKFISLEPILSDFKGIGFEGIDLVIVGAMTGKNAIKPDCSWLESINSNKLVYKKNIIKHFPQLNNKEFVAKN